MGKKKNGEDWYTGERKGETLETQRKNFLQ